MAIDTNSRTNYVIFNRINNLRNLQCLSNVFVMTCLNSLKFLYQFSLVIKNAYNRRAQGHNQFDFQQYLFIYLQKTECKLSLVIKNFKFFSTMVEIAALKNTTQTKTNLQSLKLYVANVKIPTNFVECPLSNQYCE